MKSPELEAAFMATVYRVEAPNEYFNLRIDVPHAGFSRFLAVSGYSGWGLVTAWNPCGRLDSPAKNEARATALKREIETGGWRFHPASHHADQESWPVEQGFCVFNAPPGTLHLLARRFSQLAFVYGLPDGYPRLRWVEEK
ncbi:MAG: DUF3293 domain-containing protein [Candidatus Accumulibacter sp.]|jgi:hypothetical protein|nr:DUF3293 domain-containing protein [Accumulibacter sp.]